MKSWMNILENAHVVVTGGLGFIGSNLVLALRRQGAHVTVIDPCVPGCGGDTRNLGPELHAVEWLPFDIARTSRLRKAISSARLIFNLAGEIRHQHSMVDPRRDMELNARSQLLFLQCCAKWNPGVRVVYAGTRQVYGIPRYLPVDERHPVEPVDFNGIHKNAAVGYHLILSRQGALDACVLQLSNVYGPRMALDVPGQGFLAAFVRCIRDARPITVFGDGQQRRDPLHVDDAVTAFLLAACAPALASRVYNLGGPEALSLLDIASRLSRIAGAALPGLRPFPTEQQQIDIGDYHTNTDKIRSELNWKPLITFDEGSYKTLSFYGLAKRPTRELASAS